MRMANVCEAYPCLQVKNMRKEIADLLRTSKQENARIRVETVIRENLLLQAFEVLELFMELLAVRAQLVEKSKDMPPDMIEALSSLVYSAQRLQVKASAHVYSSAQSPCSPGHDTMLQCAEPLLCLRSSSDVH